VSSAEHSVASPQTLEATAPAWLSPEEREQAGAALETVTGAESAVRRAWASLASRWPATPGTRTRTLILIRRAEALVEGPRSRLARALRLAPRPWFIDEGPLLRVLDQARAFEREATELAAVVDRSLTLREEFNELRSRYAQELPRAWERVLVHRGVSEEEIALAGSKEELDAIAFWLHRASTRLAEWHAELSAWVVQPRGGARMPGETDATEEPLPPLAALETRYELLLTIGAVDRGPALRRNAVRLRSLVRRHLTAMASTARLGTEDAILRCAREYSESQTSAALSAEEAWTYMEALSHYARVRAERQRVEGPGDRTRRTDDG